MAFDESLAARIRKVVARKRDISEKKMFGGVAFLLNDNLLVGVWKNSLVARIGPASYESALAEPHAKPFDITGKPMKGWVLVQPGGLESDEELKSWIERCRRFVATLAEK